MMHAVRFICLAILLLVGPVARVGDEISIVIGTGHRGSDTYSTGGAVCRSLNRIPPYRCTVLSTGGSIDNLYALHLMDADFSIVQRDVDQAARQGKTELPGDYTAVRTVAALYTMSLTIVTRAESDIRHFRDLKARRVAAGTPVSGSGWTFRALLDNAAFAEVDRPIMIDVDAQDGVALCNGALDAVIMMTGHPSLILSRMADTCPIRVVPLGMEDVRGLSTRNADYRPMTVPPGIYPFVPTPVPTVGTDAMLVTLASMPDARVSSMLQAIFSNPEAFRQQRNMIAANALSRPRLIAEQHPAVRRFFGAE